MTRQDMVDALVADSLNSLFDYEQDGETWARDILLQGFKGFEEYTDAELQTEMQGRGLLDE